MRVKLDNNHDLVCDSNCMWVEALVKTEKGTSYWRRITGYHNSTIETMIDYEKRAFRAIDDSSSVITIGQLADKQKALHDEIKLMLNELVKLKEV